MGYPSSGDKDFEDLRHNNKFLEAFVYAWGMVESDIEQKIIYEFGLDTQNTNLHSEISDIKVKHILGQFSQNIDFLHKIKRLTDKQYDALVDFSKKRNKLFHGTRGKNYNKLIIKLTEAEKKEYLDAASLALRTTTYG